MSWFSVFFLSFTFLRTESTKTVNYGTYGASADALVINPGRIRYIEWNRDRFEPRYCNNYHPH